MTTLSQSTPRRIEVFSSFKRNATKHLDKLFTPEWNEVVNCLIHRLPLPEKYKDHALQGNLKGFRDCHVFNDLVLLYNISEDDMILQLHFFG